MSDRRSQGAGRDADTLGLMLRSGSLTPEMYNAGRRLQRAFLTASRGAVSPAAISEWSDKRQDSMLERQAEARRHIEKAMEALGGMNSPAGSGAWHVLGRGMSVREWARREGWAGKPIRQEQAQGILIAALGVLAEGHRPAFRSVRNA